MNTKLVMVMKPKNWPILLARITSLTSLLPPGRTIPYTLKQRGMVEVSMDLPVENLSQLLRLIQTLTYGLSSIQMEKLVLSEKMEQE